MTLAILSPEFIRQFDRKVPYMKIIFVSGIRVIWNSSSSGVRSIGRGMPPGIIDDVPDIVLVSAILRSEMERNAYFLNISWLYV